MTYRETVIVTVVVHDGRPAVYLQSEYEESLIRLTPAMALKMAARQLRVAEQTGGEPA